MNKLQKKLLELIPDEVLFLWALWEIEQIVRNPQPFIDEVEKMTKYQKELLEALQGKERKDERLDD